MLIVLYMLVVLSISLSNSILYLPFTTFPSFYEVSYVILFFLLLFFSVFQASLFHIPCQLYLHIQLEATLLITATFVVKSLIIISFKITPLLPTLLLTTSLKLINYYLTHNCLIHNQYTSNHLKLVL